MKKQNKKVKDIYVVVCKNDQPYGRNGKIDRGGEIVLETYANFASFEETIKRAKDFEATSRLGKCRIAKLEFITEYEAEPKKKVVKKVAAKPTPFFSATFTPQNKNKKFKSDYVVTDERSAERPIVYTRVKKIVKKKAKNVKSKK